MTIEELEKTVMELKDKLDGILNTVNEAETKWNHDRDLEGFKERNGEALGKYEATLKKLNGDDFDVYDAAMTEYKDSFSDIDEPTYIAQLTSEIDSKLATLRDALADGDVAEATHIAEDLAEDTKEVAENLDDKAHDDVNTEAEKKDSESESETKESESEAESEENKEEEKEDEDKDELDDFQKELEEEYETYHK